MRRLTRFAPPLALLAFVAITALTLRWRAARNPWQPLPGGGEVRVLAVTHGTEHSVDVGQVSWRDRARAAWRGRSLRPLTSRAASPSTTTSLGRPSIGLWLEGRHLPASGLQSSRGGELVLPDGQAFRTGSSSWGSGMSQRWHYTVIFPIIPARVKTLHWKVTLNGTPLEFAAPNPACRTDLPVWKAERLPQTRLRDDIALTLRAVNLEPGSHPQAPTDWRAKLVWKITRAGEPADAFYQVGASFEDPAGNVTRDIGLFSEPVWKVRARISRTERFPFTDDEVRWVGTIDPAAPEAHTPRGHALRPLPTDPAVRRLRLVGLFGPGEFEIKAPFVTTTASDAAGRVTQSEVALKEATVTSTGPAASVEPHRRTEWDQTRGVHIVRLDRPALIILESYEPPGGAAFDVRLFRDEQGAIARLNERWISGSPGGFLSIYDPPAGPLRLGFAKSEPFELEFLIDAPEPPGLKKSGTRR